MTPLILLLFVFVGSGYTLYQSFLYGKRGVKFLSFQNMPLVGTLIGYAFSFIMAIITGAFAPFVFITVFALFMIAGIFAFNTLGLDNKGN